jgi:hypothetical protein
MPISTVLSGGTFPELYPEHTFVITAVHAVQMFECQFFAVMVRCSLHEALRQRAEFSFGLVAHDEPTLQVG